MLRIFLILAILASIGTIVLTQLHARKQIQAVIVDRDDNIQGRAKEKNRADKSEKDHAATKDVLQQTKGTLAKTEEELNNNKQQLASEQAKAQKLDTDLKAAVAARKDSDQQLDKWRQLGVTPEQVIETRAGLKKAQGDIEALNAEKVILARSAKDWENKYRIAMGGEDFEAPLPPGTKGKVVAVDPKWNFVVLNIGKDKGMLERGVLMVHRDSKFLGKVRIAEVLDNRCIANVVPGSALAEIQEGDHVLY
jgi:hypothetical protein